jgi:hypothetical protein
LLATFVEPKLASFWSLTLPVAPKGRVHAGAVEDDLLAVEVDELAERERVSHEVGGGVLEPLPLLRRDALPHVCGEAGMPPAEQLLDELGGDGMAIEEAGEDPLAEKAHQERGVPFRQGEEAAVRGEPPSVVSRWRWGCHCRRSPAVAREMSL